MSTMRAIVDSLVHLLGQLRPAFAVFTEEISKTDFDEPETDLGNYFFLEFIPISNQTVDAYHTQRSVLVSITAQTDSGGTEQYLWLAEDIDAAVRPVFRFDDRAITVANATSNIVDRVLHYSFTLSFMDSAFEGEQLPMMEELDVTII